MSQKLESLIVELRADIKGFQSSLQAAANSTQRFSRDASSSVDRVGSSISSLRTSLMSLGAAFAAFSVGKSIVNAGMDVQALGNKMRAAVGDAGVASDAMAYVRQESDRLGLSFQATATGFASFSASALRAGLTMNDTKNIFTGVSEAATALQLSAEQTSLVFTALGQMASKGTVSMEELRGQLGEQLPGAIQIFAKAMGVSTSEFINMVGQGEVTVEHLKKLGAAFHDEFGDAAVQNAQSAQAAFNRFGNALLDLRNSLASAGILDAVIEGVRQLTELLNSPAIREGLTTLAKGLAAIASAAIQAAAGIGLMIKDAAKMLGLGSASGPMNMVNGNANVSGAGDLAGAISGNHTLGTLSRVPIGGNTGKNAATQAQKERDRLKAQVDNLKYDLASPTQQEDMDYSKKLETLKKALDAKLLTENQYRELAQQAEQDHQDRLREIALKGGQQALQDAQEIAQMRVKLQQGVTDNMIGLLQQFAGKNKAIAIALIAIEKARAIASVLIAGQEAGMKAAAAAAPAGPAAAAAAYGAMVNLSYVSAGLIAAQGLAQIAMSGGSSGGGGSGAGSYSGDGGSTTDPMANASGGAGKQVFITLQGDDASFYSKNNIRKLIENINSAIGDGSRLQIAVS